jgi:hypothetical protein
MKSYWKVRYGGPGQKSPDYRASDAEGTLKRRIKTADYTLRPTINIGVTP